MVKGDYKAGKRPWFIVPNVYTTGGSWYWCAVCNKNLGAGHEDTERHGRKQQWAEWAFVHDPLKFQEEFSWVFGASPQATTPAPLADATFNPLAQLSLRQALALLDEGQADTPEAALRRGPAQMALEDAPRHGPAQPNTPESLRHGPAQPDTPEAALGRGPAQPNTPEAALRLGPAQPNTPEAALPRGPAQVPEAVVAAARTLFKPKACSVPAVVPAAFVAASLRQSLLAASAKPVPVPPPAFVAASANAVEMRRQAIQQAAQALLVSAGGSCLGTGRGASATAASSDDACSAEGPSAWLGTGDRVAHRADAHKAFEAHQLA